MGSSTVNRDVVPQSETTWMPRYGAAFYPPLNCADCPVFDGRIVARSVGVIVLQSEGRRDVYVSETTPAIDEMRSRVDAATNGRCEHIEEQHCWRLVKEIDG